jgi:hypothetical protein
MYWEIPSLPEELRGAVLGTPALWSSIMTLARFVTKNTLRNKRRSILTVLSIAFSQSAAPVQKVYSCRLLP